MIIYPKLEAHQLADDELLQDVTWSPSIKVEIRHKEGIEK